MKLSTLTMAAVFGTAVALGAGQAFAKAHDQGVADGTQPIDQSTGEPFANTGDFIKAGGGNGVSGGQKSDGDGQGTRGAIASDLGGDNRLVPVVNDPPTLD